LKTWQLCGTLIGISGKHGAFEPSYLALFRSGELKRRAEALEARLAACDICPRKAV